MGGAAAPVAGFYARNAIAARYALERGMWAEAAALQPIASSFPQVDAITHYARALGAARGPESRPTPRRTSTSWRPCVTRSAKDPYWTEQVDIQRQIVTAWIAFAEGRKDEGLGLMRKAADAEDATDKSAISPGPIAPARELLGEMLLEAGNAKDALTAFEATMTEGAESLPRRIRRRACGRSVGEQGRRGEVLRQVITIAKDSDNQRPELKRARSFTN